MRLTALSALALAGLVHGMPVAEVAPAAAGTGPQEAQRSLTASAEKDSVLGDQQENIEVWTDGTKEGIDEGYAAAAEKAISEAPKFEFGTNDLDPELTGCVSIQAAVNDFWCTTTCSQGGHCPKQLCKCGEEVKCKRDKKTKEIACSLKDSAAEKIRAARDTPEPEADWVAEPEAPKRVRPSCVAIAPSVTDYWCMDTCVSLLSGLVHGGCPKNACSCGKDAKEAQSNAEASKNAKPIVKQRARHEGEVGFDPVKKAACNLDKSAEGCTTDEIMKQLEDRQTAAPTWDMAHPAEKRQKAPPTWEEAHAKGAPTWDDAHSKGAPTWEDAHKNGEPTWDAAHPTDAAKSAGKAALVCVSLDISVSPDWCRTTCSAGGCPKACACGTQKDLDSGKLDAQLHPEVPAPTTNKAVIQHALACISLVPSVSDDWCLSTCSSSEQPDCEEDWCVEERKSCKATCRCGVAENLVKPGAPAIWEKVEEVPKPKCKSLSPSVMDFWCDAQCAIDAPGHCPTNVCNCDGTLQLRTSSTKKQATAPTWADAHPKPEAAEAKDEVVCKALDNSVTADWCQKTCSNGHHCPKACACGDAALDANLQMRELRPQPTAPTWADAHPSSLKESAAGQEEGSEANCRSLKAGITDFWCNTQCADGGACPEHVCNCDGDSEMKEAKPLPTAPTWADAHKNGEPTWEEAHPSSVLKVGEAAAGQQESAAEARKVCRSIKAGVLDYWCNTQCNGGNSCPSNVCSCDGDAEVKESKPLPTAPTWADAHAKTNTKGAPTAPTWDDAHSKTTKGAPTWEEAHAKTTKGAPTWEQAHPTTAKQMGAEAKKTIVCRALDTSVTESWCRNSCSSGGHCPKVCSCGPSEDFLTRLREEYHDEPQRARVSALSARQQEGSEEAPKKKCKSLKPSVMDYWCDTQCADGLKCPTNVCNCDGDLQLRESRSLPTAPTWEEAHVGKQTAAPTWADAHPSSLVPEESAVRQQQAQEAPKAKCKSLSPSVMDYWCDTQCADGLKCPTNVCSCDGSVQLRETTKGAPKAPTWEEAHPSKAKHEIAEPKIDIVCKSLSPGVSEHWCRTTCLSGSHCPKVCACGDLLRPSDEAQGQSQ